MTIDEAASAISNPCESRETRLKKIKALLDATENVLLSSALGGVVRQYKVNTGQSVIDVEATDYNTLHSAWSRLNSLYNEMCGLACGNNVMAMRDANTNGR